VSGNLADARAELAGSLSRCDRRPVGHAGVGSGAAASMRPAARQPSRVVPQPPPAAPAVRRGTWGGRRSTAASAAAASPTDEFIQFVAKLLRCYIRRRAPDTGCLSTHK